MSSTKQLTTKYQDFDAKHLSFTKFEENERSKAQNLAFPRYKDNQKLLLQGPFIELNAYGIPQVGEYYKSDKDRAFIKIPFDLSNPEVKEFYDKMQTIDELMNSEKFKKEQFGAKANKYKYAYPICRTPAEDEDEDEKKKSKYPRPPYMKIKLDVTWPETEVKTKVYLTTMKDGKRERTEQVVTNVDELASHVRYLSKIRPIITPVKAWCEKKAKMGRDYMEYGVTFKVLKIEVEPSAGAGNNLLSQYMNNDAFIDSDEEGDEPKFQGKPAAAIKTTPLPLVNKSAKNDSDDDDEKSDEEAEEVKEVEESEEESDESEEEPEPEPEPPKKGKAAAKTTKAAKK